MVYVKVAGTKKQVLCY